MKEHILVPLVKQFAQPIVKALNLELWGVRISRGKRMMIQCFVDKEGGATIDDCTNFSRALSAELDIVDENDATYSALGSLQDYTLEISTPGMERYFFNLEQLLPYIGRKVSILLEHPLPNLPRRRKLEGILHSIEGTILSIECVDLDSRCECPWAAIERIHLVYFSDAVA